MDSAVVWGVFSQWAVLGILALTAAVAWPVGRRLWSGGRRGVAFVAVLGAVLAATTTTRGAHLTLDGFRPYLGEFLDPGYLVGGFGSTEEKLANVGLFLPLGVLAMLLWRRPVLIVAAAAGLSFLIELWQAGIGRGGDAVDVVHNTFGAMVGVIVVMAALGARRATAAH